MQLRVQALQGYGICGLAVSLRVWANHGLWFPQISANSRQPWNSRIVHIGKTFWRIAQNVQKDKEIPIIEFAFLMCQFAVL